MIFSRTHQQLPILILKPYWFGLISIVIFSCACSNSNSDEENALLQEANKIHLEAMAVEKEVNKQLKALDQDTFNLDPIKERLKNWDENLIEVPGFEHDHDHDHDHDHGKALEVLPEDMLIIQQEFLDSIRAIRKDVDIYVKKSKDSSHS